MSTYMKISELSAATALAGAEVSPVVQSGATVKATMTQVAAHVAGDATSQATLGAAIFPAGLILPFGNTIAPSGFLSCDGSAVSRTTYAALFAAIGTVWGVGDGSTTFNIPDLRGAFVRGTGSHGTANMADGNDFAGPSVGATENDQMQGHYHILNRPANNLASGSSLGDVGRSGSDTGDATCAPKTDGTNGTPRIGDETRPFAAGVLYCIKT